jgi:hypothetical protein
MAEPVGDDHAVDDLQIEPAVAIEVACDYDVMVQAVKSGVVPAESGV